MTVSTATSRNSYNGNAATDTFAYTFRILDEAHVAVYVDDVLQTITTHYTVTGVGDSGGGNIVFTTPPATGTLNVVFIRSIPATQETDYVENDPFPAAAHEDALDKLTMLVQQQQEIANRSLALSPSDTSSSSLEIPSLSDRANKFLGFNSVGDVIVSSATNVSSSEDLNYIPAGTGAVATNVQTKLRESVNVKDFGAVGDGVADDTAEIQAAIDYSASSGKAIYFPAGTYLVSRAGTIYSTYYYGLMLKSGCRLFGESESSVIIKAAASSNMALMVTSDSLTYSNIELSYFTLDGNYANNPTGTMNLWVNNCTNFRMLRLRSIESRYSNMRFENADGVFFDSIYIKNTLAPAGSDCLHFYDSSNVNGSNIDLYSNWDDGLVFSAVNGDADGLNVVNVFASVAGRGILLNLADNAVAMHTIRNVSIKNVITNNCAKGCFISWAHYNNVHVDITDTGSGNALLIDGQFPYLALGYGNFINCSFDVKSYDATLGGVNMYNMGGTNRNNKLTAQVYSPAAPGSESGVVLNGSHWDANIQIYRDVVGISLDVFASYSRITALIDDAYATGNSIAMYMRSGASNNLIHDTTIKQVAGTGSLNINAGAANNNFSNCDFGNKAITVGNTTTMFSNSTGASIKGLASLTPNGSGQATIAHGLLGTPAFHQANFAGAGDVYAVSAASDATNLTIQFRTFTTGAILTTGGPYSVMWEASLK